MGNNEGVLQGHQSTRSSHPHRGTGRASACCTTRQTKETLDLSTAAEEAILCATVPLKLTRTSSGTWACLEPLREPNKATERDMRCRPKQRPLGPMTTPIANISYTTHIRHGGGALSCHCSIFNKKPTNIFSTFSKQKMDGTCFCPSKEILQYSTTFYNFVFPCSNIYNTRSSNFDS